MSTNKFRRATVFSAEVSSECLGAVHARVSHDANASDGRVTFETIRLTHFGASVERWRFTATYPVGCAPLANQFGFWLREQGYHA
jgi:hypothetical protein